MTKNGGTKAINLSNIKVKKRTNQGMSAMRFFKSDPQELISALVFDKNDKQINLLCSDGEIKHFTNDDLKNQPLDKMVRSNPNFKNGQTAILLALDNPRLITSDEVEANPNISLKEVNNEVVVNTLDDFSIDDSINLFNFDDE